MAKPTGEADTSFLAWMPSVFIHSGIHPTHICCKLAMRRVLGEHGVKLTIQVSALRSSRSSSGRGMGVGGRASSKMN